MESLPQELIDEIINNLPRSSLPSSSLVAKRWRKRSQQRAFDSISFTSEDQVNRWHIDIQKDPGGISSYIGRVEFRAIPRSEPALFSRVLKGFSSLKRLWMCETEIPDELPGHISHGEFGEGITVLSLWLPRCTFSTMVSLILSFPNLKYLIIQPRWDTPREPLSTRSVASRRGPLDLLELHGSADEVADALVQNQFVSRCLILDIYILGVQRLLSFSSKTVVELTLNDAPVEGFPPPIDPSSFPTLTSLCIGLFAENPSPHLVNILGSISLAPALTSIAIEYGLGETTEPVPSDLWIGMGKWLTRMANRATVDGGLVLILRWSSSRETAWEGLFSEFMEAGGKIETDPGLWGDYNCG